MDSTPASSPAALTELFWSAARLHAAWQRRERRLRAVAASPLDLVARQALAAELADPALLDLAHDLEDRLSSDPGGRPMGPNHHRKGMDPVQGAGRAEPPVPPPVALSTASVAGRGQARECTGQGSEDDGQGSDLHLGQKFGKRR